MGMDEDAIRGDTPGCENRIHFNNAGAALPPRQVTEAMSAFLRREAEIGGYEAASESADLLERPYREIVLMIGARRSEIALAESATRAWQMAFYSVPLGPGDRILTTSAEYPGNYVAMLHRASQTGAAVHVVPDDESGAASLQALREALDSRVKLVALTHVPTNNGMVNPAAEVCRMAREAGALTLLDAAQSAGQMVLDVRQIGCDMMAATGRKYLRGPRGTGFLYVRRELIPALDPPLLDWASARFQSLSRYEVMEDARRFETWEAGLAARAGLGAAVGYANEIGLEEIQARVVELASTLRARLREVSGVTVRDVGREQCGIVTFAHDRHSPHNICRGLSERGINTYPREATPLDEAAGRATPVVRASLHYYNTNHEIDVFGESLAEILRES